MASFLSTKSTDSSLFRLDSHKAAEYLGHYAAVSHMEALYLIECHGSVFTHQDIQALLTRTEGLKSLFLYLRGNFDPSEVSNSDIWDYLQKHKGSLETIDIYRGHVMPGGENGYFGPFHELPNLISLGIEAETLLGEEALFHLQEVLPPTIQSLTLYGSRCSGYVAVPDLPE